MPVWLLLIVILISSLAMGALAGQQWIAQKDGTPPPKPLSNGVAVIVAIVLFGIFIASTLYLILG
ncbi:MAG: NADH dehydrogenase subunit F C-terminal domain-containing protein [Defluviitaleaceae bacterium]|nr:NADH dehydrogenase subunit F C-terminal domain-containing protein [Defluviitaleaceae bacterium]